MSGHIQAEIARLTSIAEESVQASNDRQQSARSRCTAAGRAEAIVLALPQLGADTTRQRYRDLERGMRYAAMDARADLRNEAAQAIVDAIRAGRRAPIA